MASSGTELCAKFAADANFVLEYGSVGDFYSGLEGLLGPPAVRVLEGIEFEHCGLHDADLFFTTSNGMHTTSRDEFEFVVRPQLGKAYPERAALRATPSKCRRPLTIDELWEAVAPRNAALRDLREPELIRNHRRAAYGETGGYESLTVLPVPLVAKDCPVPSLVEASKAAWDRALEGGEKHGFRNAQTTVVAPTGTIGLVMDCDTTGIEPDFALVKFKKLAGGGYFKIINQTVPLALEFLGYSEDQIDDTAIIERHIAHDGASAQKG